MRLIKRITCIIGTAGHIDHGKTSLVKALTGMDTDRLAEEKKRGISIDLGFAYMDLEGNREGELVRAAIVDVPGHERFIKNMLAGVTGMDIVLFVVAADDGVMPQTREHLDIVHLLRVRRGIFVITKSDSAGPGRLAEVRRDIGRLIRNTVLNGSPVVEASAVTGKGIAELKGLIRACALESRRAADEGFFRLPVDRSFPVKGFGTVVTGTVASGSIKKGSEALLFPSGVKVKVRGIQSLYLDVDEVSAGERAAVNLSNVAHSEIERGNMLASPSLELFAEYALSRRHLNVDCLFEFLPGRTEPKERALLKVHHLTGETLAMIRLGGSAQSGGRRPGRLILKKPLLMLRGDRFILRDPAINATIGGGVAMLPYLSARFMRKFEKKVSFRGGENSVETLQGLLHEKGIGLDFVEACLMLNMRPDLLKGAVEANSGFGLIGDFIVDLRRAGELQKKLVSFLSDYHREHPMEPGVSEDGLFKAFKGDASAGLDESRAETLFKEILKSAVAGGLVRREGPILSLNAHRASVKSGGEAIIEHSIMERLSAAFTSLNATDIMEMPFKKEEVDRVLQYLQRNGGVVKLREGVFVSADNVRAAKEKLTAHIKAKGSVRASEFRDILGCGRKLAIEILEYFDKERVTLRQGDIRTLR